MDKKLESMLDEILKKVDGINAPPKKKDELKAFIKDIFTRIDKDYGQQTIMGGM